MIIYKCVCRFSIYCYIMIGHWKRKKTYPEIRFSFSLFKYSFAVWFLSFSLFRDIFLCSIRFCLFWKDCLDKYYRKVHNETYAFWGSSYIVTTLFLRNCYNIPPVEFKSAMVDHFSLDLQIILGTWTVVQICLYYLKSVLSSNKLSSLGIIWQ